MSRLAAPEPPLKRPRTLPQFEDRDASCSESGSSGGGSGAHDTSASRRPKPSLSPWASLERPGPASTQPTAPGGSNPLGSQQQGSQQLHSVVHLQAPVRPPQMVAGAAGATSVLPTSLPGWVEEALPGLDPFWRPKEVLAVIATQLAAPAPGTHGQLQSASAMFTVSQSALEAIQEKKARARIVCVQPGDGPPSRCHWYGGSYLLLNQRPYDVTREDRVQLLLGPNQADQAADLSSGLVRGSNRLTLLWPIGIAGAVAVLRLCEPVSPSDLMASHLAAPLPLTGAVKIIQNYFALGTGDGGVEKEGKGDKNGPGDGRTKGEEGEGAAATPAMSCVASCSGHSSGNQGAKGRGATARGGKEEASKEEAPEVKPPSGADGTAGKTDGSPDGDGDALSSGPITVSLRCPLHGGLVKAPAQFGSAGVDNALAFFDVEAFLEVALKTGSWVCPATGQLGHLRDLQPHAYLHAVLRTLDHNGVRHRVEAIEVAPCGRWRPKDSRVPLLSVLPDPEAAAGARDADGRPLPPSFDSRLLDPEDEGEQQDAVDLTED